MSAWSVATQCRRTWLGLSPVFPGSTGCMAGFMVSPSYFLATPFGAIARRLVGTLAPPWWVVRLHGQHEGSHRLISTRRLGFWFVFVVLVGLLFWLAHRSGGRG
jgi:hypothetical protein